MTQRGHLDAATRVRVHGWAWDSDSADAPVSLIVTVDDAVVARVLADRYRDDLDKAGIGKGNAGFTINPGPYLSGLKRHVIAVRREGDGGHIGGSPVVLESPMSFDTATRTIIANVLSAIDNDTDLEDRLGFLAGQIQVLLKANADRQSGPHMREARRALRWRTDEDRAADVTESRPRALVIDDGVPVAARDAGSNAILSHMESLQRIGYAVSFIPANLAGNYAHLEAAGITCLSRPWYGSVEEILLSQRDAFDLVYLHRGASAGRYSALVRHHQRSARLIYGVADLHFLRLARQAEVEQRPELAAQSRRMQTVEMMAAWYADAVITHSSVEAELLRKSLPAEKIHIVPWTVPLNPSYPPFKDRRGFAFIGGYGHSPNVDAARWLVEAIMPELAKLDPTIPCFLVGSDMPDSVRRMAGGQVEAVGAVANLADIFDRVRLTVAPLAFGAGVKGKVLDSLARGVPCICTPMATEGLDLPDMLMKQVAADPAAFAAKIKQMHDDEILYEACSAVGLRHIAQFASAERTDAMLGKAIGNPVPAAGIAQ